MASLLRIEQTGRRITLTLDDPRRQNALSAEMVAAIGRALDEAPPGLAALLVEGAGGVFSAGADLKSLSGALAKPPASGEADPLQALNAAGGRFFARFAALPFVTIAVVDGAAVGGGMGLAAAADIVVATAARALRADRDEPRPSAGPDRAPSRHALGERVARRLALTGARLDGREAEAVGLADFYCASDAERDAQARDVASRRSSAARPAPTPKRSGSSAPAATLSPEAYIETAAKSFAEALRGPEGREGLAAFAEKRAPSWATRSA